jgi:hypothetical protein
LADARALFTDADALVEDDDVATVADAPRRTLIAVGWMFRLRA